ncbi:hypothetical protein OJ997_27395 [Solirubrobacter phytolaccae]|uniref:Uncharacterized protein n=1 Tax=Solirubrobacter phytolaccae TaxID=1404360 RepID=A0A9X3NDG1_9ACTN|nr:hypothetical protein [Solirubrobacter phytolaccae]MDA0184064.1 hypothetical protein [Solirubrobacter phytolaccae]
MDDARPDVEALLALLSDREALKAREYALMDRETQRSWRPAPSGIERPEPHWAELDHERVAPGSEHEGDPPDGAAVDRIERDAQGELVYARLAGDRGKMVRFEHEGHWTTVFRGGAAREHRVDGELVGVTRVRMRGKQYFDSTIERYQRERDGSLTITSTFAEGKREQWRMVHTRTFTVTYAEDGEVERIVEPSESYEVYRRRRPRPPKPPTPGAMHPFRAVDHFAGLLERAGVPFTRTPGEQGEELAGESGDHDLLLRLLCELARTPVEREVDVDGDAWIVPDDQDADLLLHESGVETVFADEGVDEEGPSFYAVTFGRQLTFEDEDEEYLGMNVFHLSLAADGVPDGRVPTAQRWGYGGPVRPDASDAEHGEIAGWAGHVDAWATAVRASNSWKAFDALPMVRFTVLQSDI